jgi:hypothetical protein
MSSAGWERYGQLRQEYGHQVQRPGAPPTSEATIQIQERETHTANDYPEHAGEVVGFYPDQGGDPVSKIQTSQDTQEAQARELDTPEALAAKIGAEMGEPHERCGCTLYYRSGTYQLCHLCLPRPLRLGGLSDFVLFLFTLLISHYGSAFCSYFILEKDFFSFELAGAPKEVQACSCRDQYTNKGNESCDDSRVKA